MASTQSILKSGLTSKRIRIWALSVIITFVILGLQQLFPFFKKFLIYPSDLSAQISVIIFLMALICEYIDSSLGMGYGTTLTPLLLMIGFSPLQIVPCVLLSELLSGISAFIFHHKDGNINLSTDKTARTTVKWLCVLSGIGAVLAATFAIHIPKYLLTLFIGLIILSAGVISLINSGQIKKYKKYNIIILGTIAAFNKGLSGGGYGPLVTSGQLVSGLKPKTAVAVTSLSESVTCFIGLSAYLLLGKEIYWPLALPLILGALLSVPAATFTVKKIPEKYFKISVGLMSCFLGLLSLFKLIF